MDKDTIELVIKEMLEDQKIANKINTDLVSAINLLTTKVNGFRERLDGYEIATPPADTKPVEEIIRKGIDQMRFTIAAQPKSVTKKFQILLFPEQDAKLFYKIVFGRWFMWLAVMLFLSLFYKWAMYKSDNNSRTLIEIAKDNKIVKAWNYLYSQKNKEAQRKMDSVLLKVSQAKD